MTTCEHYREDAVHYECQKNQVKLCEACAKCKDPSIYCKFRPSCIIHFMEKERSRTLKQAAS